MSNFSILLTVLNRQVKQMCLDLDNYFKNTEQFERVQKKTNKNTNKFGKTCSLGLKL